MRRLVLLTFTAAVAHVPAASAATCDSLAVLPLQNARVTSAQIVAAGAFTPPAPPAVPAREGAAGRGGARAGGARGGGRGANQPSPYATLPAFCSVAATLTPSSDSDIKIEVWLPESATWNGKFQAVGNGGWAGTIAYPAMAAALAAGYATTSTDTGHVGNNGGVCAGSSGEGDRLRLSRRPRDDGAGQGDHQRATTTARRSSPTSTAARSAAARASRKRSAIPPTTTASSPAPSRGAAWIDTSASS